MSVSSIPTHQPMHCDDKRIFKDGKLHSVNGEPAIVRYDREYFVDGDESEDEGYWVSNVELKEWYNEGGLHRENGPARIEYKIIQFRSDEKRSSKVLEEWYQHGKLYREGDYPARILYDEVWNWDDAEDNDYCYKNVEEYYQDQKLHRENGPAVIVYNEDGSTTEKKWYIHGELRRILEHSFDEDSDSWYDTWYKNGEIHRDDGPALTQKVEILSYKSNLEAWYQNGKLHREDGPAEVSSDEDDELLQKWYQNGELHRLDGPAYIYSYKGKSSERYYRYGLKFEI